MSFVLLGILNSQAAGAVGGAGDYQLLETTILGSDASSVTFTGLGSYTDYKHLQVRIVARETAATGTSVGSLTFNSDTSSSYADHRLRANGSTVSAANATSATKSAFMYFPGSPEATGQFGGAVMDILDFSDTSKNTTIRCLSGNPGSYMGLISGLYFKTDAITSLSILPQTGFLTGSRFSLYGLKETV